MGGVDLSEALTKRAQELAAGVKELPKVYYNRVGDYKESIDVTVGASPIPVIDFNLLTTQQELEKLKSALSDWGCFQAIGHGLSMPLLESMLKVGREFFELPMEEKKNYEKTLTEYQGYGADPVPEEGQALDFFDRMFLTIFPEEKREYKFWPKNPPLFCEVMMECVTKLKRMTEVTDKAMARSLGLEENCFHKQFGEKSELNISINYYPKCPTPDLVLGLKPHTDASGYTILWQDEEGLQIEKDDKWYTVPMNPEAVLVIMADQNEIMTNGLFKSVCHQVLSHSEKDRVSVGVSYMPEAGKEIGPEEGLINEERPKKFKGVKDYFDTVYQVYYNRGERAINMLRA